MKTNPKLFKIAHTISLLSANDAKELLQILEKEYGIKPPEKIPVTTFIETKPLEQTIFDVYIDKIESHHKKLEIIKVVKEILGISLMESKILVDSSPCLLKQAVSKDELINIKNKLDEYNVTINIK